MEVTSEGCSTEGGAASAVAAPRGAAAKRAADAVPVQKIEKPKKADFRQRAHCNPLSDFFDSYPISPDHVDWSVHFPSFYAAAPGQQPDEPMPDAAAGPAAAAGTLKLNTNDCPIDYPAAPVAPRLNGRSGPRVSFLDVGCGYGGLLIALGPLFPDKLMLGLEIREQVTNYVGQRVQALRQGADGAPSHHNASVIRTNAMKFLPNYFRKGQIEKIFFCFPDPHFKRKNIKRRIVSPGLLSIYAYIMAPGALLYHATDVADLGAWMDQCCREHPLFEPVPAEEQARDPCIKAVTNDTEEAMRVHNLGKFGHDVHLGVFRRVAAGERRP